MGRASRFSLDSSLGRLARWLRLLGHDAAWERGDNLTVALSRARAEGRILLTRSQDLERLGLAPPRGGTLCIGSVGLDDQLVEVARAYPIFEEASPFSRCTRCNLPLELLSAEAARSLVPPHVAKTQNRFQVCGSCKQIYWRATHVLEIIRRLQQAARRAGQALTLREENASAESGNPDSALPEG